MTTSTDIVNQALQLMGGNNPPVTGVAPSFDDSTEGKAAARLYVPAVQTVARQFGWDFSRSTVALQLSGNIAPFPWSIEYLYPSMGIEIRQLLPPSLDDPNNPPPLNWVVANNIVGSVPKRVIQCDIQGALAVYTNQPTEDCWDSLFREAVVRLLASEFSMALASKPDSARDYLESGAQFEQIGQTRFD